MCDLRGTPKSEVPSLSPCFILLPFPCVGRAGEVWGACTGWARARDRTSAGPNKSALPHRPFDEKVVPGTVIFLPFLEKKSLKRIFRVQTWGLGINRGEVLSRAKQSRARHGPAHHCHWEDSHWNLPGLPWPQGSIFPLSALGTFFSLPWGTGVSL